MALYDNDPVKHATEQVKTSADKMASAYAPKGNSPGCCSLPASLFANRLPLSITRLKEVDEKGRALFLLTANQVASPEEFRRLGYWLQSDMAFPSDPDATRFNVGAFTSPQYVTREKLDQILGKYPSFSDLIKQTDNLLELLTLHSKRLDNLEELVHAYRHESIHEQTILAIHDRLNALERKPSAAPVVDPIPDDSPSHSCGPDVYKFVQAQALRQSPKPEPEPEPKSDTYCVQMGGSVKLPGADYHVHAPIGETWHGQEVRKEHLRDMGVSPDRLSFPRPVGMNAHTFNDLTGSYICMTNECYLDLFTRANASPRKITPEHVALILNASRVLRHNAADFFAYTVSRLNAFFNGSDGVSEESK